MSSKLDFIQRFDDILEMNIPDWILNPFSNADTAESPKIQEELMEVITNDELKFKFKSGYQQFWLQKEISRAYPEIWTVIQKFLIAFPSSYLVERGFSAVNNLLTKKKEK